MSNLVMTGRRVSGTKDVNVKIGSSENKCSEISPTKVSRYGRAHKPKKSEDFLPTDKKVGALLGLSPKKSPTPSPNVTPRKHKEKDKGRIEGSTEKEGKRRARPKLKLNDSPKPEERGQVNHTVSTNTSFSKDKKDLDKLNVEEKKRDKQNEDNQDLQNLDEQDLDEQNLKLMTNGNDVKGTSEVSHEVTPNASIQEDSDTRIRLSPDTTTPANGIQKNNISPKSLIERALLIGENASGCGWVPGDLAWARVGGHPFWPCMIAVELQTGLFTKTKRAGRGVIEQRYLHVMFYADNGRHCWISSNCVIRFEGRACLENFASKVFSEMKKKDKKFTSAFIVRNPAKSAWECAVREAEEALPQSREARVRFFLETFPLHMHADQNDNANNRSIRPSRKRKRASSDSDEFVVKQAKIEPDSTLDLKMKNEHLGNSSPKKKKTKKVYYKKKKRRDDGFSAYAEKFSDRVAEDHPEMTDQEIRSHLAKLWSELDDTEKSKYESKIPLIFNKAEEDSSAEEDEADEDNDDTTAINDANDTNDTVSNCTVSNSTVSNSTRESSPNLFAPFLKKGGSGIFRGTRQEKVCQLCFKAGNTVKCKGPCLGVFHLECIKNPPPKKTEQLGSEIKGKKKKSSKGGKHRNSHLKMKTELDKATEGSCNGEKEQNNKDDGKQSQMEDESSESNDGEFRCKDCSLNRPPPCFLCGLERDPKTNESSRFRCSVGHCGKFYHKECLAPYAQATCSRGGSRRQSVNLSQEKDILMLTCPQHVCHTCASDDPRNATMRFNNERLVRCVMCATAYHTGNFCVPAGSEILTGCQIICSKHYVPPRKSCHHVNATWCFICAVIGGTLLFCDLCPIATHTECARVTPPEGSYICEDCDTGRFPLYGEIVWVKLGNYRWWPAQILFPNQVPDNVANNLHSRGEFAVKFFGTHNYNWVNRGRVFLYQDGDTDTKYQKKKSVDGSSVDGSFKIALVEAADAYEKMRAERALKEAEARPGMKPPPYIRIKSNKAVGNVRVNDPDPASMTPCDCNPDAESPCGFGSDCINRILMVECNTNVCPAGKRCGNQCFSKRQYPPLEPFRTDGRGWGLRARKDLLKGEFVIEYVGEMIDEEEYKKRLECKHQEKDENYYFLTIDKDRMLDAGPKGNVARFMNHSCQPNCETQKWTVNGDTHVGLFALKDIPEGEELTFNYNLECVGTEKKPCMCGAPNCSGFIGRKVSKIVEDDKKLKGKQETKKKKKQSVKLTESVCFKCGDGGNLVLCDNKTCPKGYHLGCANRKTWPKGKWICPWHLCNVCNKRTSQRCGYCPNSFCGQHADGNIRFNEEHGSVCQDHDMASEDTVSSSVNENTLQDEDDSSVKKTAEDSSKSKLIDSVSSSMKLSANKRNRGSGIDKESKIKNKIKIEAVEPVPRSSGVQKIDSNSPDKKKKRGRPRKYPVGATPEMILKIKQESLSPVKNGMITPVLNPAAIVNDSTVRRKRGRPRKSLPNPFAVNSELVSNTPITPITPISSPSPRTVTPLASKAHTPNENVNEKKKKIKMEPVDRLTETPKCNDLFTPRTSNRKRQPSERLTAYLSGLEAKKNKALSVKVKEEPKPAPASSLSPSFYSLTKRIPKKTILQRIDHKPDVSKVLSFASSKSPTYKSTPKPSKINSTIISSLEARLNGGVNTSCRERTEARNINANVNEIIYRKNDLSGIVNDIHTNGILESLNETDSQYFDGAVTTIPLKCPEFVQTRNEFLVVENDDEACVTGLENHLSLSGDSTEKLTEDGKYQILTNVCPDTLASIDTVEDSLLLDGES